MYWSYLNGVIEQKQQEIADTKKRLQELQKIIEEIEQFEAQRKALEQKLAVIAQLEKEQKFPVHLLDEVYQTLEADLWLESLSQSSTGMTLQGTALSNPVVSNYLRNLENSSYFNTVELIFSRSRVVGSQNVRDFQISAGLTSAAQLFADPEQPAQE
ncbi:hypothetical protein GF339_19565 [candidate division KSB3 bacterium]|uniref:Fimbrial assembly protein n=1 Tax=candidate division KSB3 bacterium TaxID=2044937 RepID=A0A9D5JYV4_9BACT|nr:hypothetical protein [candidate division KSB3 bacterium]